MLDLGTVRPGSTIRIPFSSFDKDDGSSITMTNYAAADILVYKDGGTTERASTSGFTATTDFDTKTGKHLAVIDLADNTTSGFWNAGSEYLVAIDAVTVDAVTTGGWIARFRIGYPGALLDTTIATLSTQTSFTLTAGPAEDDAINGRVVLIHDIASAVQVGQAIVADYTGSTKTVTLVAGTTFTAAAGDNISVMDLAPLVPTVIGRTLDVSSTGEAGVDWANVGSPTTSVNLSGTTTNAVSTATAVTTVNGLAANTITATSIAADAKALMGVVAFGTMQAGSTSTTAVLASSTSFADDIVNGAIIFIHTGTGAGQRSNVTDWVNATDTATVDPPWVTTPDNTSQYVVFASASASTSNPIAANVTQVNGTAQTAGDLAALINTVDDYLDTEIAAIKAKTDNLPASPAAVGSAMTLTSAYDFAKGTTAMTESYATDGAAMTPAQALHQIWSLLAEKNIASTTLTAKKLDGSTTAMTFTLDSATSPTSITRAS